MSREWIVSSQPMPGRVSSDLLQALRRIESVQLFPKGATLFQQGSAVTGVYVVESGEVRVLLPARDKNSFWRSLGREPCLG